MSSKGPRPIRTWLRQRGVGHTIPERADQIRNRLRRGSRGGRPPASGKQFSKQRNVVERCFNRLKQGRGIATRYDKTVESCQAAVALASLLMWAWHVKATPKGRSSSVAALETPSLCRVPQDAGGHQLRIVGRQGVARTGHDLHLGCGHEGSYSFRDLACVVQ